MAKDKSKTQGIGWGPLKILINRLIKRIELLERRLGWYISTGGGGTPTPPAETVITGTYDEIKALKDNSELIIGARYVITDYQTKYFIEGSNSSGLAINNTVDSIVSNYIVFAKGYDYLLKVGKKVEVTYLPPGYNGVGEMVVGSILTCSVVFSDYYFGFTVDANGTEIRTNQSIVGMKIVYYLDRYEDTPNDTVVLSNGKPVIQPQGVCNTDVHDGTPYMDMTGEENLAVPVEQIVIVALDTNSFESEGYSSTFEGDTIYYDFDDTDVINDNEEVIDTRKGRIFRRINFLRTVDLEIDWRVRRFRRYLFDLDSRLKFTQTHHKRNLFDVTELVIDEIYDIVTIGDTDFTLIGSNNIIDATAITIGDTCKVVTTVDTDYTLIGSNNVIAATAITLGDVCKIETVGDTDYTLIGSPDNVVGTIFIASGVGVGTGTVDIGNNVGTIFTATDVGIGTGTVDIGNNIGSRFTATGVGVGTGTVVTDTYLCSRETNQSIFKMETIDETTENERFYASYTLEDEINVFGRWGEFTKEKMRVVAPERAKDYTILPLETDGSYEPTSMVDKAKFDGFIENVIFNAWPNIVLSDVIDLDATGTMINVQIGAGCQLTTGSSFYIQDFYACDKFRTSSGMSNALIERIRALAPMYIWGANGLQMGDCVFGGCGNQSLATAPNDNSTYCWITISSASGAQIYRSLLGWRTARLAIGDSQINNSVIHFGLTLRLQEAEVIQSAQMNFSQVLFEYVAFFNYHRIAYLRLNNIGTFGPYEEKVTGNKREWIWNGGNIVSKEVTFNEITSNLIEKSLNENDEASYTVFAEIDKR